MKHYVTFGQVHVHSVNGRTLDKDSVAVYEAHDPTEGRAKAFQLFGDKFMTDYHGDKWNEADLSYYPRGYIHLDEANEKPVSRAQYDELKRLANAIIGPACDILPDTYTEEVTEYYAWLLANP